MTARELLRNGDLTQALKQALEHVKAHPQDTQERMFLFEVLCFAGQWERAAWQLDALETVSADPPARDLVLCRDLLGAQRERDRFISTGSRPRFFIEPPSIFANILEAWDLFRAEEPAFAVERLEHFEAKRSAPRGRLGTVPFEDFRDTDDLFAGALEAFAGGAYYWVPWEDVEYLDVRPPRSVRDLIWAPARIAMAQGVLGEIYLPCLYPASDGQSDDTVRIGRKTAWVDVGCGLSRGVGLKTFLADDAFLTIFELRDLYFDTSAAPSSPAGEGSQPA
jgi:type VI secretion system protein ImpE